MILPEVTEIEREAFRRTIRFKDFDVLSAESYRLADDEIESGRCNLLFCNQETAACIRALKKKNTRKYYSAATE